MKWAWEQKENSGSDLRVDVSFTLKKKHAFLTAFALILVLLVGFVVGYATFDPSTFGHSWGEMACVNCIGTENVGTGALDKADISSNGVWNKNEIPGNLNTTTNFVDGSDNTLMTIQNTGKVGIGITNPGTKLDVVETGYTGTRYSGGDGASTFKVVARSGTNRQINFDVGGATTSWGGVINQINSAVASGSQQYGLWNTNDFSNTTNLMTQINTDGSGQIELRKFGTGLISNLNFINNGNTAITIDSAGKVGIGTTSPAKKLSVAGGGQIGILSGTNPLGDAAGRFEIAGSSGELIIWRRNLATYPGGLLAGDKFSWYSPDATSMRAYTDVTGDLMTITSTGKVGIGTTAPSTSLSISKVGDLTETIIQQNITSNALHVEVPTYTADKFFPGIVWTTLDNNPTKPKIGIWGKMKNTGSELRFGTSNNYTTGITNTAMVINEIGNIGIGTPSPGSKLTIEGTAPIAEIRSGGYLMLRPTANDWDMRLYGGGLASNMFMGIYSGGDLVNPRMVVTAPGKVGIGTASPNYKLMVDSSGDTVAGWFKSSGATELYVGSAEQAGDIVSIRSDPTNNYGNIRIWGDTEANGITIKSGGKVGIGTTSPNYKLEVSGTLGFTGGTGPFCIFANACPTGWVSKGLGGYISNTGGGATCPYSLGGAYNPTWYWCHPVICCTS